MSGLRLVLRALGIGVGVVVATKLAFAGLTGRPLTFSFGVDLVQMVMVAIPFLMLAMGRVRARLPWLTGLALTAAFWGYYLYEGVRYQWSGDTSGANIGLGLILLASPVLISFACIATYLLERRRV